MKFNKLFILPLIIMCFFVLCSSVDAMTAPRAAKTFYFTQIEAVSTIENKATIFEKQSCFSGGYEECAEYNNDKKADRLFQGSGYSSEKYTKLGAYDAIPIVSFNFNKENWEIYEDENENQVLRSLDGDKEIFLYGESLGFSQNFDLASEIVEESNKGKLNKVNISEYEIINGLIFVFGDSSINDSQLYYTITPFPIIMKANNISEQDKLDFKKIINTLEISKQEFGNLIWHTYQYPQGSYPRLFDNLDDLTRWAQFDDKTYAEKEALSLSVFNGEFDVDTLYARDVPAELNIKLQNKFDYSPQYNSKNVSFVGATDNCEINNEVICIDDGDSWDYVVKEQPKSNLNVNNDIIKETSNKSFFQKYKYYFLFGMIFIAIIVFVIYWIIRKRKMKSIVNVTIEEEMSEIDEANSKNEQNE